MNQNNEEIHRLTEELGRLIPDAKTGLPLDVFYFISRLTPLVNVDLLIQDEQQRTLLVWRQDAFYRGWHIPGGVIRFKEKAADRIKAVAAGELGAQVTASPQPVEINEKVNCQRDVRGHFIAFLYRCTLLTPLDEAKKCMDLASPLPNQWAWHLECPDELLPPHQVYRRFFVNGA